MNLSTEKNHAFDITTKSNQISSQNSTYPEGETSDVSSDLLRSCVYLLIAAVLWGGTNPFLRRGTQQVNASSVAETKTNKAIIRTLVSQFVAAVKNWQVSLPFVVNQCGSLFFYLGLAGAPLSFAVPFANSLTFFFTTVTGFFLGEYLTKRHVLGMLAVILGIFICTNDFAKQ